MRHRTQKGHPLTERLRALLLAYVERNGLDRAVRESNVSKIALARGMAGLPVLHGTSCAIDVWAKATYDCEGPRDGNDEADRNVAASTTAGDTSS